MYANRFDTNRRLNPGSLGIAVGVNGAVIAALIVASPSVVPKAPPTILETYTVPPETPPPEPLPQPKPDLRKAEPRPQHIDTPQRIIETIPPTSETLFDINPTPPLPPTIPSGAGTGAAVAEPLAAPPLFIAPSVDPRYAADFQPVYPAEERRAGREGKVTVRVLIGIDGRVKEIQPLTTTSDAFFRVTADRARSRWRFKPATRGGIPVEAWRTMNLNFVLED